MRILPPTPADPGRSSPAVRNRERLGGRVRGAFCRGRCQKGLKLSEGVAAWLRHSGIAANSLDGGALGWAKAGLPMVPEARLPLRDARGRTVWETRSRPQDRPDRLPLADPSLRRPECGLPLRLPLRGGGSRRALCRDAVRRRGGGRLWSHRGELCTFDVMVEEFGLGTKPLQRLATIVRGADTARLDLAPEAPGLLAPSLGLSRMYAHDLAQLEAGMALYDAFYRWSRDATDETDNWPATKAQHRQPLETAR